MEYNERVTVDNETQMEARAERIQDRVDALMEFYEPWEISSICEALPYIPQNHHEALQEAIFDKDYALIGRMILTTSLQYYEDRAERIATEEIDDEQA